MTFRVNIIAVLSLIFSCTIVAEEPKQTSSELKKSFFRSVSDFGIPIALETSLEGLRMGLEPVKNAIALGICGTGPMYYVCWYFGNVVDLQKYNIQNGLSRHLQDKVSSFSQDSYSSIFAPQKPKGTANAASTMEALRTATLKSQSTESVKSRITLAQLKPLFDSLFSHASEGFSRKSHVDPTQSAARTIAYAAILLAAYLPEYNGDEPELRSTIKACMEQIDTKTILPLIEKEVLFQMSEDSIKDAALMNRVQSVLCVWMAGDENHKKLCLLASEKTINTDPVSDSNMHAITWAGLIAPSLLFNLYPQKSDAVSLIVRTTFNSISQNLAEAATRVDALDFFANMRRNVQRLGVPEEKRILQETESYQVLRDRQFRISNAWSELGLRMRANILRYLGIIVPTFIESSKLYSMGRKQQAAATLASLLSYIRQYDPEYGVNNIHLKTAAYTIFADTNLASPELYAELEKLDPGFKDPVVREYYETLLRGLSQDQNATTTTQKQTQIIPWSSAGLSLFADLSNTLIKGTIASSVSTLSPQAQTLFKEVYARFGEVVVRGAGEPAKEDIQQALASAQRTQTEKELVSGCVEMNGRTGSDAQIARAIYERMQPILVHIFDSARDAYESGDKSDAARLIAYGVTFIAFLYPETPTDDILISGLAKSRFSQFMNPNDLEFNQLVAAHIAYYDPTHDPILACALDERLSSFGLSPDPSLKIACQNIKLGGQSWSSFAWDNAKSMVYFAGMGGAVLLPAFSAIYMPRNLAVPGAPAAINLLLTCIMRATVGIGVTSVFNGITTGFTSYTKSIAQRWSQYFRITHRVDESENWGRAQAYFAQRQWELPLYLNPSAQEGRKDLLLVAQNIAQSLRNARVARRAGNHAFETSQFNSLQYILNNYFSEGLPQYKQILADMKYAFFGEVQPLDGPSPIKEHPARDEL